MTQIIIGTIGIWFTLIAMLLIATLSIIAYRKSLKKIFILFMIISIPLSIDGLLSRINHYMVRHHHRSLSSTIFGRDYLTKLQPPEYRQMSLEKFTLLKETEEKNRAIDAKYSSEISGYKKKTWPSSLWMNLKYILGQWMLSVGVIMVCLNEIKSSNHRFHSIAGSARSK